MSQSNFSQNIVAKSKALCDRLESSVTKREIDPSLLIRDLMIDLSQEATQNLSAQLDFTTAEAGLRNIENCLNVQALTLVHQEWVRTLLESLAKLDTFNSSPPIGEDRIVEFKEWLSKHLEALESTVTEVENSTPPGGDDSAARFRLLSNRRLFNSGPGEDNSIPQD